MATPSRRPDPSVAEQLFAEGYRFDFYQAVRVLEKLYPQRKPIGQNSLPSREVVRFRSHLSLSFPPSEIYQITKGKKEEQPVQMVLPFLGLTGISGVLPLHYTELLMERIRAKDPTLRDFFDLFNHRFASLFYRVWEKHHLAASFEKARRSEKRDDRVSHYLFDFMGLGTKGMRNRVVSNDRALLCYAGLIGQRPRSASALQQMLTDYVDVPVRVDQLLGAWLPLGEEDLTRLSSVESNNRLGHTAIAGRKVWDQQARFRLSMGPMNYKQFSRMLPSGKTYPSVVQVTKFFVGPTLDFVVRPVLEKTEVPACRLGKSDAYTPNLGWNTWLKTKDFSNDADNVTFSGSLNTQLVGTA